ncbi:hypothetical protein L7F22_043046 [Adiantum nelumboides]|nr:hypothetical protein [Adiantum nelumboides]
MVEETTLWLSSLHQPLQQRWQELQERLKSLAQGNELNAWLEKQLAPMEISLTTAINGALMGVLTRDMRSALPTPTQGLDTEAMASLQQAQALAGGPLVQACNFAVIMTEVSSGLACATQRARADVEDIQTSIVAIFESGALFYLVNGDGGLGKFSNAFMSRALFALIQRGMYKLSKAAQPPPKDLYYSDGRMMLHNLGFDLLDLPNIIKGAFEGKGRGNTPLLGAWCHRLTTFLA